MADLKALARAVALLGEKTKGLPPGYGNTINLTMPVTDALALVNALTSPSAPPRDPDDGMIEAGEEALREGEEWCRDTFAADIWQAMYDAWKAGLEDPYATPAEQPSLIAEKLARELESMIALVERRDIVVTGNDSKDIAAARSVVAEFKEQSCG